MQARPAQFSSGSRAKCRGDLERRAIWRHSFCAKIWKGLGAGVLEIAEDFDRSTYRAVCTVRFRRAIYVLHCFQKKSPSGVRTAKHDIELIEKRLRAARGDYEERYGKGAK